MKHKQVISDRDQLDELMLILREAVESGEHLIEVKHITKTRSLKQNAALHLYLTQIAEQMTDAGYSQRLLMARFKTTFDLPVTMEMIKEIFKESAFHMHKVEHTSDLTTVQLQEVYEAVNRGFAESVGVSAEWPSLR